MQCQIVQGRGRIHDNEIVTGGNLREQRLEPRAADQLCGVRGKGTRGDELESVVAAPLDGLGDFASTMWATGQGNRLEVHGSVAFPHSLGLCYTAISQYLGFWKFGDEYKVMGLAAYGDPQYRDEFRHIVATRNGSEMGFRLGLRFFSHHRTGPEMTWRDGSKTPVLAQLFSPHLEELLGPTRPAEMPLEPKHKDVAATLQAILEEAYFRLLNPLYRRTRQKAVCLAGGVAFNCVANGKIFDRTPFTDVYVQPAAGDAGLAVGAAYYVYHQILGQPRKFVMEHAGWGPQFDSNRIRRALEGSRLTSSGFPLTELPGDQLARETAKHISEGKVVGWFQGRAEWGPRALGNRSILVDPRRAEMKDVLNQRIKRREPFRPFAPSILEEAVGEYFERSHPSPFMNLAYSVRPEKRAVIPAPTHVDGTGRLQTVSRRTNPLYWSLIKEFERVTGVPVLLNTSFNENEPIVLTPEEAIDCFLRTKMDVLHNSGAGDPAQLMASEGSSDERDIVPVYTGAPQRHARRRVLRCRARFSHSLGDRGRGEGSRIA